jgi:hypothetical protein
MGAFMRIAVIATVICCSIIGLATADNANASIRKSTHIASQGLGPALEQLAQSRGLQVLYLSSTVRNVQTHGADGDITAEEAFDQLLTGTGLTYRYLDKNTITVVPLSSSSTPEGAGVSLRSPDGDTGVADSSLKLAEASWSDKYLLAAFPPQHNDVERHYYFDVPSALS